MTDFMSQEDVEYGYINMSPADDSNLHPYLSDKQHIVTRNESNRRSENRMRNFFATGNYTMNASMKSTVHSRTTNQSKKLPKWVMTLIFKLIGIKTFKGDKPVLATFLFFITILSAAVFFTSRTWYKVYSMEYLKNKLDLFEGSIDIILVLLTCAFGCYCHHLTFGLMKNQVLVQNIRSHSKTLFKINLTYFCALLIIADGGLNIAESFKLFNQDKLSLVSIHLFIYNLHIYSRIIFTCINTLWMTLIIFFSMSICRTHTIALRRFLKELNFDSIFSENVVATKSSFQSYIAIPNDESSSSEDESDDIPIFYPVNRERLKSIHFDLSSEQNSNATVRRNTIAEPESSIFVVEENNDPTSKDSDDRFKSDQILYKYWKFSSRLKLISNAFQKWLAIYLALVVFHSCISILKWLNHSVPTMDMLKFATPLLILPIVYSSFAEINTEGQKLASSIYPMEDRITLIQFLKSNPLQVTVYGFPISYGNITAVIFGIILAVSSRLIVLRFK